MGPNLVLTHKANLPTILHRESKFRLLPFIISSVNIPV